MKAKPENKKQKQEQKPAALGEVLQLRILYFVFVCYIILLICGAVNHEAWRDEAQAWLLVRDTSLAKLLATLPSEGHPPLWYLLIWPLVKLGIPYESQNYLTAFIMIVATGLFLFRTKLPVIVKCLLPFSYFFLFEYAFFARSYCLIVFFIAAILALYPRRFEKPWLFAACIVGLFNTHILVFSFTFCLVLLYVADAHTQKILGKKLQLPIAVMAVGGLYLLPYLGSTKMSGSFKADVHHPGSAIAAAIEHGLLVDSFSIIAILLLLLALAGLVPRPKLLLLATGGIAGILFILAVIYPGAVRHEGNLFLILVAAYGLQPYYVRPEEREPAWPRYNYVFVVVIMLLQLQPAMEYYAGDLNNPYSGAKAAAVFIKEHQLQHKLIVGEQAWAVSAILPYLPDVKKIYYAECERYGTYYVYDDCYNKKTWQYAPDFALNIAHKHFCNRLGEVILIVNRKLQPKSEQYLDMIYTNEDQPIRIDETFYIYKFKDNVR